ncbi:MFS transporter [Agrilactobacillus yilanensis]|nr:MFS transporter [Agrilactobacillus yilanensis]
MKNRTMLKLSILLVSVITASAPAINANIPVLAKAFPNVPLTQVELLTTIPSFFLMLALLISDRIARKIGIKNTVILGVTLTAIAGLAPLIINRFWLLMLSRAAFGFGVGLFNSLLVVIISYFFQGQERSQTIGFQSTFEGFGGVLVTFIAGQLVQINWHMSFWAYVITVPALILFTLFVPQITNDQKTSNVATQAAPGHKGKLAALLLLTFIVITAYMIMGIKVPTLMVSAGYGTATDASYVILGLSLGAMLGGVIFGRMFAALKNYILPVSMLLMAIAMALIALSNSTWLTVFGGFVTGVGVRQFFPWILNSVNADGNGSVNDTALILIVYNLAGSLSPYSALLIQKINRFSDLHPIFWINVGIFGALTVITLIIILINGRSKVQSRRIS